MQKAKFIFEPKVVIPHGRDKDFLGPGVVQLPDGNLMMIVPSGPPPTDFGRSDKTGMIQEVYISEDGGRNWLPQGPLTIEWKLSGMMFSGGVSLMYLHDGRLAIVGHRFLNSLHGGGTPVFSTTSDNGKTWRPARMLIESDDTYYVMNNRLRQLDGGRLIVPVAQRSSTHKGTYIEGDACDSLCFYSDDFGDTWKLSPHEGRAFLEGDLRGMAEPAVEVIGDKKLIMLARTGAGCLYRSYSYDAGLHWSKPQKTNLISPCSSLTLQKRPDGSLVVFYNHCEPLYPSAFFPRNPLVFSVSYDEGLTWSSPVCIDNSGQKLDDMHRQHIYPTACFTDEGMLVLYSTHWASIDGQFKKKDDRPPIKDGGIKAALIINHDLSNSN